MPLLRQVASAVKSANAGISWLTFDIVFPDQPSYDRVRHSNALNPELFATLYKVPAGSVQIYECDMIRTIKVTIPRASHAGRYETDYDGVQQFPPLLDVEVLA
jgi:Domain of unknown function (DUF4387)